jgi:hypothetical protein
VSGTASRVAEQYRDRALGYSDHALREALHQVGIKYYAAFSMFFDPAYLRDHPELTPVNVFGDRMQQAGWYVGLCPSSEDYLQHKIRASTARSSHDRDTSTGSTGWTGDVLRSPSRRSRPFSRRWRTLRRTAWFSGGRTIWRIFGKMMTGSCGSSTPA